MIATARIIGNVNLRLGLAAASASVPAATLPAVWAIGCVAAGSSGALQNGQACHCGLTPLPQFGQRPGLEVVVLPVIRAPASAKPLLILSCSLSVTGAVFGSSDGSRDAGGWAAGGR